MQENSSTRVAEFVRLLTTYELRLRSLALSLTHNWADADDVTQKANLVMWEKFDQFQPSTNFFSWAAKIVSLTAMDARKRRGREIVSLDEHFIEKLEARTTSLATDLGERERFLSECIQKLSDRQRSILSLKYEKGNGGDQIAAVMKTSADAIYKSLARIRASLIECVNRRLRLGEAT